MRFIRTEVIKNDMKCFERYLSFACSKHAIIIIRNYRIVSIIVELEIDVSDDVFYCEYVRYRFDFNKFNKKLFKLLSIYDIGTKYHCF